MTEFDGPGGEDVLSRVSRAWAERFEVIRSIGSGAMAHVYLARDLKHRRDVAIKVLKPEVANLVGTKRFLREIEVKASFRHPNILPLYDSGEAEGLPYFVTPYFPGGSLEDRLARDGPMPVPESLRIVTAVAEALGAAHALGIVHRDVKPGNILLDGDRPIVADFGLSKVVAEVGDEGLTVRGLALGTPGYTSPEQGTAGRVDCRTDIYSLACVLYEMLTGELVFDGSSARALLSKHIAATPTPLRSLRATVPESVDRAVLRALSKTPADRPASMAEFVADLTEPVTAGPNAASWIADLPRPIAGAVAAALTVGGLAVLSNALSPSGPAWTDRPSSIVVLPFEEASSTQQEREIAVDMANAITQELHNWDGVRAFDEVEIADPRGALQLDGTLARVGDGHALARALGAQALAVTTASTANDSAFVVTTVYDVASGDRVVGPVAARGPSTDIRALVPDIAAHLLGFGGLYPDPAMAFSAGTRSPDAASAFLRGLSELDRGRLGEAEAFFASAADRDPTFASALTFFGHAVFWGSVERGEGVLFERGSEIVRASTSSMDHLDDLRETARLHAYGFFAFQMGDYQAARETYARLLELDPMDKHALLMAGAIEEYDFWMTDSGEGSLRPRSSLERAWRSYSEAIRTYPTFGIAYGRLLGVQRAVEVPLDIGGCPGFEAPTAELVPPWDIWVPTDRRSSFCPVAGDSIAWLTREEFNQAEPSDLRAGADQLLREAVRALERWAAFAPTNPRPRESLAAAALVERARLETAAPEHIAAVSRAALEHYAEAMALVSDTLPRQLVELANLHLAAGEATEAGRLATLAVERYRDVDSVVGDPPASLMNPLVVVGQVSEALTLASGRAGQSYQPDPQSDTLISYAGAEPILERIKVLAASGIGGHRVSAELDSLDTVWSRASYSSRVRQLLRSAATPGIAAAFIHADSLVSRWGSTVSTDHPSWLALTLTDSDPIRATDYFDRALLEDPGGMTPSVRAFVLGTIASRLGRGEDAVMLYSRLDSIPSRLSTFDSGWGLRVLSYLARAREYQRLGNPSAAASFLEKFEQSRVLPDSLAVGAPPSSAWSLASEGREVAPLD